MTRTYTHRIRVRFGETDNQAVVFYANYVAYFDILMTELWRDVAGGYTEMVDSGIDMVVIGLAVRYHAPAVFDDELDLTAQIKRLGTTSISTAIEIVKVADQTTLVTGDIHHVFIDVATKQKRPIPDDVRARLEPYLLAEEPAPTP